MPYFPKEDEGITLTLKSGDTVTLKEKEMSAGDRKAISRRAMAMQYDFRFKSKIAEEVDKKIEAAGLDRRAFDDATSEAIDLASSVNVEELYGTILSMRFQDWDVYASQEDLDANRPVPLTVDGIVKFASERRQNLALVSEIIDLLRVHDGVEEKNASSGAAVIGSGSTATPLSE
jgi:hypothetical protein